METSPLLVIASLAVTIGVIGRAAGCRQQCTCPRKSVTKRDQAHRAGRVARSTCSVSSVALKRGGVAFAAHASRCATRRNKRGLGWDGL
jgi:hypothetical protein